MKRRIALLLAMAARQFCAARYDRQYHRYGFHCHPGRLT
jgi:hypothetical protein